MVAGRLSEPVQTLRTRCEEDLWSNRVLELMRRKEGGTHSKCSLEQQELTGDRVPCGEMQRHDTRRPLVSHR